MRIGSLFTGYGGLDLSVESATAGQVIWMAENDSAASVVLRHHRPDVPNLGDVRAINWRRMAPVDVLVGGFPCQDVSNAGRLGGLIRLGDKRNRSGLWASMAEAIRWLSPKLVIAENVRGILSAKADATPDLLNCSACVAHSRKEPLRALSVVLGDLAELGYDAAWKGFTASGIGACHQRFRIFLIAWPTNSDSQRLEVWRELAGNSGPERSSAGGSHPDSGVELLPTPTRADGLGGPNYSGREGGDNLRTAISLMPGQDWGIYEPAIRRWERLTRPAPRPIDIGPRGGRRLSPRFVEWMMGLPDGYVTGHGLKRNDQITVLGNGVVPQQGTDAISRLVQAVRVAA